MLRQPPLPLPDQFDAYDETHPHIYEHYRRLAFEWLRSGRPRAGIGMISEVMRWSTALNRGADEIKIPNQFRAFYARKLMLENPELEGLFQLRPSVADDWLAQRIAMRDAGNR